MKFILTAATLCMVAFAAQAGVKTEEVKYKIGETEFTGYLAYDDATAAKRPGIVVVHEWWGHNPYARKRAEMLAGLGYTALALDMYGTGKLAAQLLISPNAASDKLGQLQEKGLVTSVQRVKRDIFASEGEEYFALSDEGEEMMTILPIVEKMRGEP